MFDCFTKLAKNDNYNYGTTPQNVSSVIEDDDIPDTDSDDDMTDTDSDDDIPDTDSDDDIPDTDSEDDMTDNIIPIRENANCIYFNLRLLILVILILFSN